MKAALADFFLIGAQKAGTTTLAAMLDEVAGVCLSRPKEPMLFCFDDYAVHHNEFLHPRRRWQDYQWERDRERLLDCYRDCFAHAREGDLRGDASTSYALSPLACRRIHQTCPEARIIMILRDPVGRALSSYWHGVRTGLRTRSLEDELRFGSGLLLEFGHYEEQLHRYIARFGREHVLVVHFEDLVRDSSGVLGSVLSFLGVPVPETVPPLPRLNESFYPRFPRLHRAGFGLLRRFRDITPHTPLSFLDQRDAAEDSHGSSRTAGVPPLLKHLYRSVAMTSHRPAGPGEEVRAVLEEHFRRTNAGLSELLGEDVFKRWGW